MKDFKIGAYWRTRTEAPHEIAGRLKSLTGSLRRIAPQFERWYYVITENNVPELEDTENWLVSAVAARVVTDDLGAPAPAYGYFMVMTSSPPTDRPRKSDMDIAPTLAVARSIRRPSVRAMISTGTRRSSAIRWSGTRFWRSREPSSPCGARPDRGVCGKTCTCRTNKKGPVLTPCWMIHLSPQLAQRITPPRDVTIERFADGSLFLSVTDQTFEPENPEHVAAAHRLFAVLDPLQEKKPPEQWRR